MMHLKLFESHTLLSACLLIVTLILLPASPASAPVLPDPNDNLGVVMDYPPPLPTVHWYSTCVDNGLSSCNNPIWKDLSGAGYTNGNFAGNNAVFTSAGGTSDMFVDGLPFQYGHIYEITFTDQIINSVTDNDLLQFQIFGASRSWTIDSVNRSAGRTVRSVLVVGEPNLELRWHFVKPAGSNINIRFRADNLQIVDLPLPVLRVQNYDANNVLVWWDAVYGREQNGTYLWVSPTSINPAWKVSTDTDINVYDASNVIIGNGKLIPMQPSQQFFRLEVSGSPSIY